MFIHGPRFLSEALWQLADIELHILMCSTLHRHSTLLGGQNAKWNKNLSLGL